jgi:mevalonate kinase
MELAYNPRFLSSIIKCPSKLIISGEHSVVYGKPALVIAINKYLKIKLEVFPNEKELNFTIIESDKSQSILDNYIFQKDYELLKEEIGEDDPKEVKLIQEVFKDLKEIRPYLIVATVSSEIP